MMDEYFEASRRAKGDAASLELSIGEIMKSTPVDEVYEAIIGIGNEELRVALTRIAVNTGVHFDHEQVVEIIESLPCEVANYVFELYSGLFGFDDFSWFGSTIDEALLNKAMLALAHSEQLVTWQEYYKQGIDVDYSDEVKVARLAQLESFGPVDEVYDFGAFHFCDDEQCSLYVDAALAAGIRFDFDQTVELAASVQRETANRLLLNYSGKLTHDKVDEISGYVDDEAINKVYNGEWVSPARGVCTPEELEETRRQVETALINIANGEKKKKPVRHGFLAALVAAFALAGGNGKGDRNTGYGGFNGGQPDVFGQDYGRVFEDEQAQLEYNRRVRLERYESGETNDEFEARS